jgi:hypothetical protein
VTLLYEIINQCVFAGYVHAVTVIISNKPVNQTDEIFRRNYNLEEPH